MTTPERLHARVTVDVAALTVINGTLQVLTITRGKQPYQGLPALPGGHLEAHQSLEQTACDELAQETGIALGEDDLIALTEATRFETVADPRGPVLNVAYLALFPRPCLARAGDDAAAAHWKPVDQVLADGLAFDHGATLKTAIAELRTLLGYSNTAARLCDPEFTVAELRAVYEVVWDTKIDPGNFHRKIVATALFEPTGRTTARTGGRPAALYRPGQVSRLPGPLHP